MRIKFGKKTTLGLASYLLAGIVISYLAAAYTKTIPESSRYYASANAVISSKIIPNDISDIFMNFFIIAVGLIAGKGLGTILKKYGIKFVALAVIITAVGAAASCGLGILFKDSNSFSMSGMYTGALTSTPGLSAALENASDKAENYIENYNGQSARMKKEITGVVGEPQGENGEFTPEQIRQYQDFAVAQAGVGYTLAYPFGVIIVIICINLFPVIFKIDTQKELEALKEQFAAEKKETGDEDEDEKIPFAINFISFFFVLLVGYLIGMITVKIPNFGDISLGATGGILVAALACSAKKKFLGMNFRMSDDALNLLSNLGVSILLASTGLKYGQSVIDAVAGPGILIVIFSLITGFLAIATGYFVGRYVFKMNWVILSGALCGGMTSTPGLGTSIQQAGNNMPAAGYGATYPFAVLCMVLFTIVIQNIPF